MCMLHFSVQSLNSSSLVLTLHGHCVSYSHRYVCLRCKFLRKKRLILWFLKLVTLNSMGEGPQKVAAIFLNIFIKCHWNLDGRSCMERDDCEKEDL